MDRTRGISAVVSGPPSALQIHLRRSAAGAGHVEGVMRAAQAEARRSKAGRGGAATSLETLAPKPAILTTSATEESGQRTTIAAGRGTARDAGQESELTEQLSVPARGTGAAGCTELVKAEKTLLAAAGNTHQLERVAAQLRYEAEGTTFVPSYMKRSRSPSSTRAALPLHGQQQQRRGRQQQHQERRWQEHQQQQHYGWPEREQKLEECHKRHPNSMQKQEPFHEQHSVQQPQRSPWSRRGQDLHDDLLNLTPLSGHTIFFDTIMERTETGRQTFHRRRDDPNCCSCRSSCGTVSGTHEHAQGREQQKGEPSRSHYHNAQHMQNQEKGQNQQQQLHQHPSSHPIPTFSLQFDTENTRRLPGVQERDERQHQPQHRGDEQQQRRQEHRRLSPRCTLREAERLDVCQQQQSQGSEDVLQEHYKQQRPQQAQQSKWQQNHVQYVDSHARQQICADKCVKRESAFSCADATESTVVAAALDSDSRGGARNFNSRAQHVSQEELRVYPAISRSLTDRSSVVDIAARCRHASLNRASATENRSTSLARAAALTESGSSAHVTRSVSIRRSATASLSTAAAAAPAAAASAAATGHDSRSTSAAATAAAASCSSEGAAQTSGPDGSAVGVAARGAAPRRKQLSGAQKRKRKRELMSKCRVEHASLLSFLATTVTSELILNDWYALESQLRDESAYFERLSSSAWSLPAAVAALSPLSVVSAGSSRLATGPHSQDTDDAAASIADSSDNGEHCELRPRLHLRGGKVLNTATQSQPRKEQDDLQWQEGEKKRQFYQKPQSQDQQLNRRNDEIVREAQQDTSEAQGQDGAGQRLHWIVMPDSESWDAFNDRRMAAAVMDGDHASGSITSSRATSGSVNNSSGRCSTCDVLPPECARGIRSSNAVREVNSGTETICSNAAAYVESDGRCSAGSARTAGIHALFNGGSNTSSSSSTNASGDRRRPTSGSGVSARNSCSTASKDASEPADNRGTAAFAVVPTTGINGADEMKNTAAAAGAERRHPTPSDFLEGDERLQELEMRLLGKTLHAERNCSKQNGSRSTDTDEMCYNRSNICSDGSTTRITEKNSAGSNHNRSVSNRHGISSKDVSDKERSSMSDEKRCLGCSSSSSDGTNCGGSSEWNREVKVGDRSLLQQLYKGIQTNVVPNACADRHTAAPRSPLHNPLTTDCRGGEKAETLLEFANETARERCFGKQELDCTAAPEFVPPDSVEFSETATQVDGTAACFSWRHYSLPSATDACAATLVAAGDKSPTDATSHQDSSLLRPEQRQGPQIPRTFWGTGGAARLAIEGRPVVCGKEMQPLVVCNSIANKDPDEEGEGGAEGGSHSTAKQSAAATVTEAGETGCVRFTTLSCDGVEGATASCIFECSSTGSNETTTIPKRRSSFDSSTTSHCIGCLRSSTPTSSSAHSARSPSHRLSSMEPDSAAGMLPIWKRNNAPPAVDDEASTASSSPVPALQQLPAPLLWLPPHCDGNKSSTLSPCSSFSDPELTTAASLSACVDPRRFAEDSQDQHLQQSQCHELHAQQDQLTHQRPLQLHAEQQTLLPVLPAQRQQPQKPVERQQEIPQDVPARKRQEEHDTLSNSEPSVSHARGGTRQSSGQRQQRRVSAAEADDPLHDPALWPTQMTDALRISLVKRGPVQVVDFDFPRDSTQRRFGRQHYWRTAATGERYWRSWLVYSKSRDAVYCFCCKLYSQLAKSVVSTGFRRWKGAAEVLRSHEQSKDHRMCMLQWKCMCLKVGAEVAFGDLMQLWLPCGSSAASAASLGSCAGAAAASAAGVAAPSSASVDAEDGERVLKDRTENKVHAAVSVVETAHIPSKK